MDPLWLTRARVRYWNRVYGSLAEVFDGLLARQDQPLARSLGWLLQRSLRALEGEGKEAAEPAPLVVEAAAADGEVHSGDLVGALRRAQRTPQKALESPPDDLDALLQLALAYCREPDEAAFETDRVPAHALADEFRSQRHLAIVSRPQLLLLPPPMEETWWRLQERIGGLHQDERRLSQELSLLRVMRALYALALGMRTAPENLLLAHRLGESMLSQPAQRATA